MNYKCVCIISFIFFKFRSTVQNHSFNWRGDSTRLLKLHVLANIFSVLPHSSRLSSVQIFCFDILNLKLFDFQTYKFSFNFHNIWVNANLKWRLVVRTCTVCEREQMCEICGFVYNKGHQKSRENIREIWRSEGAFVYVFCLSCPSATFALQHSGFVPREWLAAKGLLWTE